MRYESPHTVRIVAALLAAIWVGSGSVALAAGVATHHWLVVVIGLAAIWYGVIWAVVAREKRRLTLSEAMAPWRLRRSGDSDA